MKLWALISVVLFASVNAFSQPCLNAAKEVPPKMSAATQAEYQKKLEEAEQVHLEKPNDADSIIWLGRRTAYLGNYKKAIWIFSSGITLHKNDARFYRHRGHRYLTLRCFDDAIKDFETAAKLIKGQRRNRTGWLAECKEHPDEYSAIQYLVSPRSCLLFETRSSERDKGIRRSAESLEE